MFKSTSQKSVESLFVQDLLYRIERSIHDQIWKGWSEVNPLSANFTKWSNTLTQFVGKFPTNCLGVFDHFAGLALKWLTGSIRLHEYFTYNFQQTILFFFPSKSKWNFSSKSRDRWPKHPSLSLYHIFTRGC